jgi:hypothetical protein
MMLTPPISQFENNHPKLRWIAVLMATALLATACGGGGGGDAAPVAAAPPAGTPAPGPAPAPAGDVAVLADIEACPAAASLISSSNWYTQCLVGKRLVGKDPITSEACELRLKANGVFEYVKNGMILSTTKPVSEWLNSSGGANVGGSYSNQLSGSAGSFRLFGARLTGGVYSATGPALAYNFEISVLDNKTFPNNAGLNEDTVKFDVPGGKTENCKLNNI